jgi:hypothetical protein
MDQEIRKMIESAALLYHLRHFGKHQSRGGNWTSRVEEIPRIHRETLSSPFAHFFPFATTLQMSVYRTAS